MTQNLANWAGNVVFSPARFHQPRTVDELRAVVAGSRELRVLGTGHSFSPIADTPGDLVELSRLPSRVEIADDASSVTVSAGTRYGDLVPRLHDRGLALHNLGSLPHIAVAGACSTGTHGSGDTNRVLAAAVRAVELVTPDGELRTLTGPEVSSSIVSLGLLGVVTSLTLAVEPSYDLWQLVYDDVPEEVAFSRLDEIFGSAYSVSLFTTWRRPIVDQLWLKGRVLDPAGSQGSESAGSEGAGSVWLGPAAGPPPAELFGARLADGPRHPIAGVPPLFTTEQCGVPGPWYARLPHFKLEFTPSAGEELQSEYLVPREVAADALAALGRIRGSFAHLVQVSEFRSVAADELWLSPAYGRDSVALHFTWVPDQAGVTAVLPLIEDVLAEFDARPHWGKVFTLPPATVRDRYPRWAEFAALADGLDPRGKLRNPMLRPYFDRSGA